MGQTNLIDPPSNGYPSIPLFNGKIPDWFESYYLRFRQKFVVLDPDSCWVWTGCKFSSGGHGAFSLRQQAARAHVLMFELCFGPIPKGIKVLHNCDNPLCINPKHLFLGTQRDNLKDMIEKGRHWRGAFKMLTPEEVRGIRIDLKDGCCYNDLVRKYNVGKSTLSNIAAGRIFKDIV